MFKQKKHIIHTLTVALGILLFSCEEPFNPDIDITDYESMLVVDGVISNREGPFRIRLSSSVPLDTTINELPVYGARVEISDDRGNSYALFGTEDGWYETQNKFLKAEPGVAYMLSVETADGMQYESTTQEMQSGPEIDKVHYREVQQTNFDADPPRDETWLEILVDSKGPENETSYVKWEYEETWEIKIPDDVKVADNQGNLHDETAYPNEKQRRCWVTAVSNSIDVESSEKLEVNEIRDYTLRSIAPLGNQLDIKYSINVVQYTMNKEMYTFWKKLQDANENLGSMFDKTPSSIYGNITCCNTDKKALGYFMVAEVEEERIFITKADQSVRTLTGYEDCTYSYLREEGYVFWSFTIDQTRRLYNNAPQCLDCSNTGTNIKPPFWE